MNEKAVTIVAIVLSTVTLALLVAATALDSLPIQKAQAQTTGNCVTARKTAACMSGNSKPPPIPTPTPAPSNCTGIEDESDPATEAIEQQFGDNDTVQPPGVVCPPWEDEPSNQEGVLDQ